MFIYIYIYTPHSISIKFTTKYFSNNIEQYIIMITWSVSDPNYDYTVILTNLNTGVMYSCTIQDNENGCVVTDLNVDASVMSCTFQDNENNCSIKNLSVDANYNVSVAAVNVCGNKTSDPITVYNGKYLDVLM